MAYAPPAVPLERAFDDKDDATRELAAERRVPLQRRSAPQRGATSAKPAVVAESSAGGRELDH